MNWQRLKDIIFSLAFMGSLWQLEIAEINLLNGWPFGWPFCILWPNNWFARDFFFLIAILSFIGVATNKD